MIDGDQRRFAGGESLFDIQPVAAKFGCSQRLQKELDTITEKMVDARRIVSKDIDEQLKQTHSDSKVVVYL